MSLRKRIAALPVIGPTVVFLYRFKLALSYYRRPLLNILSWMFRSREITNFTYNLHQRNLRYLAALIANITETPVETITEYMAELEQDAALKNHIAARSATHRHAIYTDVAPRYGRRLGWYAIVRALKPKVVVETGVDKGLGACVICAALMKNSAEGSPGRYYGTDINPQAGFLLAGPYKEFGEVLYGDSITSLASLDDTIDVFINDSDHSSEYEAREYQTIEGKLSRDAIILGDNAHVTDELLKFAQATQRSFLFFQEQPIDHWYPGGGIGFAFKRVSGE